jgi:hypothetical protein
MSRQKTLQSCLQHGSLVVSEDILNQLAYFVHNEARMPAGLIRTVIEEIERLRSAGDALAIGVRTGRWDAALDGWDETRGH